MAAADSNVLPRAEAAAVTTFSLNHAETKDFIELDLEECEAISKNGTINAHNLAEQDVISVDGVPLGWRAIGVLKRAGLSDTQLSRWWPHTFDYYGNPKHSTNVPGYPYMVQNVNTKEWLPVFCVDTRSWLFTPGTHTIEVPRQRSPAPMTLPLTPLTACFGNSVTMSRVCFLENEKLPVPDGPRDTWNIPNAALYPTASFNQSLQDEIDGINSKGELRNDTEMNGSDAILSSTHNAPQSSILTKPANSSQLSFSKQNIASQWTGFTKPNDLQFPRPSIPTIPLEAKLSTPLSSSFKTAGPAMNPQSPTEPHHQGPFAEDTPSPPAHSPFTLAANPTDKLGANYTGDGDFVFATAADLATVVRQLNQTPIIAKQFGHFLDITQTKIVNATKLCQLGRIDDCVTQLTSVGSELAELKDQLGSQQIAAETKTQGTLDAKPETLSFVKYDPQVGASTSVPSKNRSRPGSAGTDSRGGIAGAGGVTAEGAAVSVEADTQSKLTTKELAHALHVRQDGKSVDEAVAIASGGRIMTLKAVAGTERDPMAASHGADSRVALESSSAVGGSLGVGRGSAVTGAGITRDKKLSRADLARANSRPAFEHSTAGGRSSDIGEGKGVGTATSMDKKPSRADLARANRRVA